MGAIEHLTVAVPAELAARLRRRVAAGDYAEANDIVAEALQRWDDEEALGEDPDTAAWIRREVVPALAAYERDPARALTEEQVLANLAEARRRRIHAG